MCSVAIHLDNTWLTSDRRVGNRHSELLLPTVTELLAEAGIRLGQLDGIAYGKGPGSFTGLRIGCGIAQGLALGADLPVLGVVTLEAMAWGLSADRVIACLDARMNEVYHAAYRRVGDSLITEIEPCVGAPERLPVPEGTGWVACGGAWQAYPETMRARFGASLERIEDDIWPSAMAIAELALPRFRAGEGGPPERAEPFYVRDKVALTTRERAGAGR